MAGNPKKGEYGTVYDFYKKKEASNKEEKEKNKEEGKRASEAIAAIVELRTVETLKQTFILPLIEVIPPSPF